MIHVGRVVEITRYPIKSMAGVSVESAFVGFHGVAGDRRFAFRRLGDGTAFPFLTASKLPRLVLYQPIEFDDNGGEPMPTHVRTPSGAALEVGSAELQSELGGAVELMKFKNGIFDDGTVSVITTATIAGIGREAGMDLDRRRFRANIIIETDDAKPFDEDGWVGGTLLFGESEAPPELSVTRRDERCMMINLDPETAAQDARVMKAAVRLNDNYAGVYTSVLRTGIVRAGDRVSLVRR
jgi:uncharacterized protein YcbX